MQQNETWEAEGPGTEDRARSNERSGVRETLPEMIASMESL
jgi:hypothetical protein